mmetsp:Transcript_15914/g.34505  ORF Transcript_15914/g.34505 Transcript_15914/m.34505 type:complete len:275 (+) Transcript_15914:1169-1993(+)
MVLRPFGGAWAARELGQSGGVWHVSGTPAGQGCWSPLVVPVRLARRGAHRWLLQHPQQRRVQGHDADVQGGGLRRHSHLCGDAGRRAAGGGPVQPRAPGRPGGDLRDRQWGTYRRRKRLPAVRRARSREDPAHRTAAEQVLRLSADGQEHVRAGELGEVCPVRAADEARAPAGGANGAGGGGRRRRPPAPRAHLRGDSGQPPRVPQAAQPRAAPPAHRAAVGGGIPHDLPEAHKQLHHAQHCQLIERYDSPLDHDACVSGIVEERSVRGGDYSA